MNKMDQTITTGADTAGKSETDSEGSSSSGHNLPVVYKHPETAAEGRFTRWLSRLFSFRRSQSSVRDDLSHALTAEGFAGEFTPEETAMINNILALQEVRVEDLLVPRAEVEAVDLTTSLGELLKVFESSGHSRMPVYDETLDDPRGMVHIRDVVAFITRKAQEGGRRRKDGTKPFNLSRIDLNRELGKLNLVRPVLFVPPSMPAAELMARMQASRIQMALVIDEYGGTEGLISLEDIVEEIVGDIEDEHDDDEEMIRDLGNGRLVCDARAELDDIREVLGDNFDCGDYADDADTIGGVIFSFLGRIPVKGEVIEAFGYEFVIRDADPRRIRTIEMAPKKRPVARKQPGQSSPGE